METPKPETWSGIRHLPYSPPHKEIFILGKFNPITNMETPKPDTWSGIRHPYYSTPHKDFIAIKAI